METNMEESRDANLTFAVIGFVLGSLFTLFLVKVCGGY